MNGPFKTPEALGNAIRTRRKRLGATQAELAGLAAVGSRFVGEVEQGKPTAEFGKVLRLLDRLGLGIYLDETNRP
jgi:HTH-type transcriptional regulator / antitoxin HipB